MEPVTISTALWQILTMIAGACMTFFAGWSLYLRKQDKEKINTMAEKLSKIENTYATDTRVRELIREEIQSVREEVHEVKVTLANIQVTLQAIRDAQNEEKGFRRAMDALEKGK